MRKRVLAGTVAFGLIVSVVGVAAAAMFDFGIFRDIALRKGAMPLFGVEQAVFQSGTDTAPLPVATANGARLALFAKGLHVRVVTQGVAAPNLDQMALWPDDLHPTHLIVCNEQDVADPGLQSIDIATGDVTTLVTGTTACDPVRRTPWGTIVFGEEAGGGASGGRVYELIDPLAVHDVVLDRDTGTFHDGVGADHFVARPALGRLSFEGFGILANGVMYFGDENRPSNGTGGGGFFKFIPASLRDVSAGPIASLDDSPFVGGSIFGLRLGVRSGGTDYGQGTNEGLGVWVALPAAADPDLRQAAADALLTGFYRPEDAEFDEVALAAGNVRLCEVNTGNESVDHLWGNVLCITDGTVTEAGTNAATPDAQLFVQGNPEFAMMDNVAYQPGRGNWLFMEDGDGPSAFGRNNDIWDCLPDGGDADLQTDGCIRIATLRDLVGDGDGGAEWTGGIFDATGKRFFVVAQHNETGSGVILEVTGWK